MRKALLILITLLLLPTLAMAQKLTWDHSSEDLNGNPITEQISYDVYAGTEREAITYRVTVTDKQVPYTDANMQDGDYAYVTAWYMRDGVKHLSKPSEIVKLAPFRVDRKSVV